MALPPRRRVLSVLLGLGALTCVSTACSAPDPVLDPSVGQAGIVVGAGNSDRDDLIAQVYANALARTGVTASVLAGPDRATNLARLDAGDITVLPDYTGELLAYLAPGATPSTPDDVFKALNRALPQGITSTDYGVAQDRATVVTTPEIVRGIGGASLDKLGPRCAESTLGIATPLSDAVVEALAAKYGCTFGQVRTYSEQDLIPALESGAVGAVVLPGLSPELADSDVVPLADDESAFVARNVVPIFRTGVLSDAAILKLNVVGAELTNSDVVTLLEQVEDGADPATAAREWLDQRGL